MSYPPTSFPLVPARRLLALQTRPVAIGSETVTAFRDGQVIARSKRRTDGFTEAEKWIGYQGVDPGDLVVHSMDGFAGAIGVSESHGKMSPVVHIYSAGGSTDLRYVAYYLRVLASAGVVQSLAKGIRERSTSFDKATLADLPIPAPPVTEQRRIADFLDDQTARIDNIIAAHERQVGLIASLRLSEAGALLPRWSQAVSAPLSACALVIDTEHKTAPSTDGGGYWSAGTSAVRNGRIMRNALVEIGGATYGEWTQRGRPKEGDVVLTREAPVGEVALLGSIGDRLAIGQRVVLLKPLPGLEPSFLRLVLMSELFDRMIVDTTQGSLHPHLNMSDISRFRIPMVPAADQKRLGEIHTNCLTEIDEALSTVQALIDRLAELKRSLITAAVSGEFDVSAADGSQVLAGAAL